MGDDIPPDHVNIPAFATGGFVKETGLAIVHKDEYILPAAGSEATIEPMTATAQSVINYYFPVEIVVMGALTDEDHDEVQSRVWEKLSDAMQRLS